MKYVKPDEPRQDVINVGACTYAGIYVMFPGGSDTPYCLALSGKGLSWCRIKMCGTPFNGEPFETLHGALTWALASACTVLCFADLKEYGQWLAEFHVVPAETH